MVEDAEVNHSDVTLPVLVRVGKNSCRTRTLAARCADQRVADEASRSKRRWSKVAITLGPVIVMVSIVWEMARTNPVCGFFVEARSLRGYEMDQGRTSFVIDLALLLLTLAVAPKQSVGVGYAAAVVGFGTIGGAAFAHASGPDVVSITFSTFAIPPQPVAGRDAVPNLQKPCAA